VRVFTKKPSPLPIISNELGGGVVAEEVPRSTSFLPGKGSGYLGCRRTPAQKREGENAWRQELKARAAKIIELHRRAMTKQRLPVNYSLQKSNVHN
jgi:hypothetical protein